MIADLVLLVPLGLIGLVRWASWTLRRIPAALYRPASTGHVEPLTVVTPVYQEDPEIFARAIESWLANDVADVIAVIDVTDVTCQEVAARYPVRVVVTDVPGKRDALRRGWELASTPLVALVDSDTIWADDVARRVAEPFADPTVGGVATRQNVLNATTVWQRLNDFYLDYRYFDEVAGQTRWGRAVSCLSGRTAVYRRTILLDISDEFMRETFWGVPCNSGDDKRLTMLTLRRGHRTVLQQNARVWSTFPTDARGFFKQRLRWARNTWRSDLRALGEGWVFRHPWLAFTMIDKALSTFTPLIPPVLFVMAIDHWTVLVLLIAWWMVSRTAKYLPHFQRRPRDLFIVPAVIVVGFALAVTKVWALCTIRQQRWLTRKVAVVGGQIARVGDDEVADGAGGSWGRRTAAALGTAAILVTSVAAVGALQSPGASSTATPAMAGTTSVGSTASTVTSSASGGSAGTGRAGAPRPSSTAERTRPAGASELAAPAVQIGTVEVTFRPRTHATWLGLAGLAYLASAVTLEGVRRALSRRTPWRGRAPLVVQDPR